MSQVVNRVMQALVIAMLTLCLLEVVLRSFPQLIHPALLVHFQEALRVSVAQRIGHRTIAGTREIPRDDRGPPLRVFQPYGLVEYPDVFSFDEDVGAVLRVRMDELGFCNPRDVDTSSPSIKIVTVGDSMTWCHTVRPQDTFAAQLGDKVDLEVYNLALPGVGPYEYIQLLKTFGVKMQPDYVIMGIYEGNDIRDAMRYWTAASPRSANDLPKLPSWRAKLARVVSDSLLMRHSYATNTAVAAIFVGRSMLTDSDPAADVDFSYTVKLGRRTLDFNTANLDADEVLRARELIDGRLQFDIIDSAIREFAALARKHNFEPVIVFIPSAHTAYWGQVKFNDPSLHAQLVAYSRSFRKHLHEVCSELDVHYVDSTHSLREAAERGARADLLYFPTNLHLTPRGHQVIALTLGAWIRGRESGLISATAGIRPRATISGRTAGDFS